MRTFVHCAKPWYIPDYSCAPGGRNTGRYFVKSFRWGVAVASGPYRRRAQVGEHRRLSPEHTDSVSYRISRENAGFGPRLIDSKHAVCIDKISTTFQLTVYFRLCWRIHSLDRDCKGWKRRQIYFYGGSPSYRDRRQECRGQFTVPANIRSR
jgi:hypothetical protein